MKKFLLGLFCIFLLIGGCSQDIPTAPSKDSSKNGNISFRINKTNTPQNVYTVTATLTRAGFDTLSGSLNLKTDSTAEITFSNISAGSWHLTVDAKDSSNSIIYSGETDATVLEDVTTNVNLTLSPQGSGMGSLHVTVNWGATTVWTDYAANPVFTREDNYLLPNDIIEPQVVFDNGVFKMWYTSVFNSAAANIWYAESSDGINWNSGTSLALSKGQSGAWDDYTVEAGPVLKDSGSTYKMYYNGFHDQYGKWSIGLATSVDGKHWTKYSDPVLSPTDAENQIIASCIVKVNWTYYLYYTIRNYPNYKIGVATSPDGVHFEKSGLNPILQATDSWESAGVLYPSVMHNGTEFKMIYGNAGNSGFGMATSADGINWTKDSANPFFTTADVSNNWCSTVAYPNYVKLGNEYMIYYTGRKNSASCTGVVIKN